MREKLILVDCDGVLVNWTQVFMQECSKRGLIKVPDSDQFYKLAKKFYNTSEEDVLEVVREVNDSPTLKTIPAFKDAVPYIRKLHEDGFRFHVITAMSENPDSKVYRVENLQDLFGKDIFNESNVECLSLKASKHDVLKKWENSGLFWIEDLPSHARDGMSLGLFSILIDQPYNKQPMESYLRIVGHNPWEQIYRIITNDYKAEK